MTPTTGNGTHAHWWRWALGVAGGVISILVALGANAQLRRLDSVETRLLLLERQVTRLETLREREPRAPPLAEILRERE